MPNPNPQNPLITSARIRYSHFPDVITHAPDRTSAETHSACRRSRQKQMLTRRGTLNRFAVRGKGGPIKLVDYSIALMA